MNALKLVSDSPYYLKPLIESALTNELRLMEVGIRQAESRLQVFEEKYSIKTLDFISAYEDDTFEENMDFIEWIGEFRLLERLQQKAETLKGIHFAN